MNGNTSYYLTDIMLLFILERNLKYNMLPYCFLIY